MEKPASARPATMVSESGARPAAPGARPPGLSTTGELPALIGGAESPSNRIAALVTSLRAVAVALGMYPAGSMSVQNALTKVLIDYEKVAADRPGKPFVLAVVESTLVVDGAQLEDKDQKKDPVVQFVRTLRERNVASVTLPSRPDRDELIRFMTCLSKRPRELEQMGVTLSQLVQREGVKGIKLDEMLFVATTKAEEEKRKTWQQFMENYKGAPLGDGGRLSDAAAKEIFGDPEATRDAFRQFAESINARTGDGVMDPGMASAELEAAAQELYDVAERTAQLMEEYKDDPEKRQLLLDSLLELFENVEDQVLVRFLMMEEERMGLFKMQGLDRVMFQKLDAQRIAAITDALCGEVERFQKDASALPEDERKRRADSLKQLIKNVVQFSQDKDVFLDVVERLGRLGLVKESVVDAARKKFQKPGEKTFAELLGGDGKLNMKALDLVIKQLDKSTPAELVEAVGHLSKVLKEVAATDEIETLMTSVMERVHAEQEMLSVYREAADFLRQGATAAVEAGRMDLAVNTLEFLDRDRNDPNQPPEVQAAAEAAISAFDPRDVARMVDTVLREGTPELQGQILAIMRRMDQRALPSLLLVLRTTQDRAVRRQILDMIAEMGSGILPQIEKELYNAKEWYYVRNLIMVVARVGNPESAALLTPFLQHEDTRVRREVLRACCALDPAAGEQLCMHALEEKTADLKRFAVTLIGAHGSAVGAEKLIDLIPKVGRFDVEPDAGFQREVVRALEQLRPAALTDRIVALARAEPWYSFKRTKPPSVRAALVRVIGAIPSRDAVKALKELAADTDVETAQAAQSALAPIEAAAAKHERAPSGAR